MSYKFCDCIELNYRNQIIVPSVWTEWAGNIGLYFTHLNTSAVSFYLSSKCCINPGLGLVVRIIWLKWSPHHTRYSSLSSIKTLSNLIFFWLCQELKESQRLTITLWKFSWALNLRSRSALSKMEPKTLCLVKKWIHMSLKSSSIIIPFIEWSRHNLLDLKMPRWIISLNGPRQNNWKRKYDLHSIHALPRLEASSSMKTCSLKVCRIISLWK